MISLENLQKITFSNQKSRSEWAHIQNGLHNQVYDATVADYAGGDNDGGGGRKLSKFYYATLFQRQQPYRHHLHQADPTLPP